MSDGLHEVYHSCCICAVVMFERDPTLLLLILCVYAVCESTLASSEETLVLLFDLCNPQRIHTCDAVSS